MKLFKYSFLATGLLMGKIGFSQPQVPVDLFTGRVNVGIPIWTLKSSQVDVPVVLSYNGGGMKVDEREGNAGIGWNVNLGGSVSRDVRDIPDDVETSANEIRKGWLHSTNSAAIQNFVPSSDDNLTNCSDELSDYNFLNTLQLARNDTEPDLFTIRAPGLRGQFFFDGNKNLVLAPYQDLDIDYSIDAYQRIISFTITRNDGVKYFFNVADITTKEVFKYKNTSSLEYDFHPFKTKLSFCSAWSLSSIVAPNSKTIIFVHSSETYAENTEYRRWLNPASNKIDTLYVMSSLVAKHDIVQIKNELHIVSISRLENSLINSISISPNGEPGGQKRFFFDYTQVRNVNDGSLENEGKRYFLNELKETNTDCSAFPSYKFEYYDVDFTTGTTNIPIKNGFAQDLWGYYNGAPDVATSLIPAIYYKETASGAERIRINPHPIDAGYMLLSGTNRGTNPTTVHYGSLSKIYYPPGGYAQIGYEPAEYYDSLVNVSYQGGGVRVAQVVMSSGDNAVTNDIIRNYQYKRADNQSSGKLLYPPIFGWFSNNFYRSPDNMAPEEAIYYTRVSVIEPGIGRSVYEYHLPGTYSQTVQRDWEAPSTKVARSASCTQLSLFKNGYFGYPFSPTTNFGFERGLLSKVFTYSESNSLLKESSYNYNRISPVVVYTYALRYAPVSGGWIYSRYKLIANVSKLIVSQTDKIYDPASLTNSIATITSFSYSPTHYLLNSTSVTNSDNSILKTEYKYAKDFSTLTNPSEPFAGAIKLLNDNNRHGTTIETIRKFTPSGGTETVIGADITAFLQFPNAGGMVLPAELYTFSGSSGFLAAYAVGNSQFKIDPPYRKVTTIFDYDGSGNILSIQDSKRNIQSFLYKTNTVGTPQPLPRAVVSGAKNNEVFHNLFDFTSTQSDYLGDATNPHTGQLAMAIPVATSLSKDGILRAPNANYKFTARVRASVAQNIAVKSLNGSVINATKTIAVPATGGAWHFIEDELDMSSVSSPFKLEVVTSGAIDIDEVSFFPTQASLTSSTYDLVYGKLSDTNSKGISSFVEYDNNGRIKYLKDQDKNILQVNEYQYKAPVHLAPSANFSSTFSAITGHGNFYISTGCIENVTYTWYVNDVIKSSGIGNTNFSYSFTSANPRVKLEVSASGYETAIVERVINYYPIPTYSPEPCAPILSISLNGSALFYSCDPQETTSRNFTLSITGDCIGLAQWQYKLVGANGVNSDWLSYPSNAMTNFTFDFTQIYIQPQTVLIRFVVISPVVAESNSLSITYIDEGICH